jgi:hypothetical protein
MLDSGYFGSEKNSGECLLVAFQESGIRSIRFKNPNGENMMKN